jgi:hypothetical protein
VSTKEKGPDDADTTAGPSVLQSEANRVTEPAPTVHVQLSGQFSCTMPNCDLPLHSRGLCNRHYCAARRAGAFKCRTAFREYLLRNSQLDGER